MESRLISTVLFSVAALLVQCAGAEPWVDKMFEVREHDFGSVARGADTVYRFAVKNIYKQDIELTSVTTSCGCTTPTLENRQLKTGQVGYVVATFNTRTFTGMHGATLTVNVKWKDGDLWRRGESQLRVHGNIRSDVVFQPGAVKFESVDQGAPSEQLVEVTYAGRSSWKIVDVRGDSEDLEVELSRKQQTSSRVAYQLLVRLKGTAPPGHFTDQLVLVTNDEQNPRIPIHVSGRVVPQLSVAPEPLVLDDVKLGQQVSKKFIVRGKKPFRIVSIQCDEDCFQFNVGREESPSERHVVEIVFNANKDVGNVKQLIHITTDMGQTLAATLTAYVKVVPSDPPATVGGSGANVDVVNGGTASAGVEPVDHVAGQ